MIRQERTSKKYYSGATYTSLLSILTDICTVFNEPVHMVKSPKRSIELIMCRQIFIYVSILKTGFSSEKIAHEIGRKDHSTSNHHFEKVTDYLKDGDADFIKGWRYYLENSLLFNESDFLEWDKWKVNHDELTKELQKFKETARFLTTKCDELGVKHHKLKERCEKMEAALLSAQRLKTLWAFSEPVSPEHLNEAVALEYMANKIDEALAFKHEGINEKEGENEI